MVEDSQAFLQNLHLKHNCYLEVYGKKPIRPPPGLQLGNFFSQKGHEEILGGREIQLL